jgi:NAD(P) transhydrogenase subunit beta
MPGPRERLLAEADVPYGQLLEMDEANSELAEADVARSPIYGMPIIDVDKARTVMVIKRSMKPGFAGIDNELYYLDRTLMLFGDAKAFVADLVKAVAEERREAA